MQLRHNRSTIAPASLKSNFSAFLLNIWGSTQWTRVEGCADTDEAREEIMSSIAMYKDAAVKPNF